MLHPLSIPLRCVPALYLIETFLNLHSPHAFQTTARKLCLPMHIASLHEQAKAFPARSCTQCNLGLWHQCMATALQMGVLRCLKGQLCGCKEFKTSACEQENGALSGTDRSHRRSSVSESQESQQRSPSNNVDMDASPAGLHPPPWLHYISVIVVHSLLLLYMFLQSPWALLPGFPMSFVSPQFCRWKACSCQAKAQLGRQLTAQR